MSAAREEALAHEQTARHEAEAANAVKDEFLAAVSHELRTPLTTIKTLTRILLRKDTTEGERQEFLSDIASECDRQTDLVNNLLDLSRIRAGGVPIEPRSVDAAEILAACEKIERIVASERGHDLARDYPALGDALLVCATETRTRADIETYARALGRLLGRAAAA